MLLKKAVAVGGGNMTKSGIKSAATIILVIPGDGAERGFTVVGFIAPSGGRVKRVSVYCEQVVQAFNTLVAKLVPLISPPKAIGHEFDAGEIAIEYL